jgi:hypothetical protein
MKNKITKTFQITADEDVMKRFEHFMCFLHYNGGHSGIFAMPFDGDGFDSFECYPEPEKITGSDGYSLSGKCSGIGQDVEIAEENGYSTVDILNFPYCKILPGGIYKFFEDGKIYKKVGIGVWEEVGTENLC